MMKKLLALAMALVLTLTVPLAALAEEYDLANGSITVEAREGGKQYVTQEDYNIRDQEQTTETVIKQTDSDTSSTTNTITIKADENQTAEVTISDVNIDVSKEGKAAISSEGDGNVTIELDGDNTAKSGEDHAGVEKSNDGNLTITDADADGALEATGGFRGAGIGGGVVQDVSNITIEGGDITATGGEAAAGIGGGGQGSGSDITIKGDAQVKATGGEAGAGIGGGRGDNGPDHKDIFGSNITIEGNAQVDATGGASGAGIGSGKYGSGSSNITIRGNAQVSVKGGTSYAIGGEGVGIGDGGGWTGIDGSEVEPNTDGLTTGSIAYYAPGADKGKDAPEKLLHKDGSDTHTHTSVTLKSSTVATCTENATVTYLCGCNAEITTELLGTALGHKLGDYASNNDATCIKDGTKTARCIHAGCGYFVTVADEGTRDPSKHSFTNYISNGDATCTADGTKTAKCAYGCGAEDTQPDAGSKLEHKFDTYVPNNDATCTTDGTETAQCAYGCGATDTRNIPNSRLPHEFKNYVYQDDATCLNDGTEIAQCEHCAARDVRKAEGTALGHSFTHYVSNNNATYDADGTQAAKCDRGCGASDTVSEPGTRIPLYRVVDAEGREVSSQERLEGDILTVTADRDEATLTGGLNALSILRQRGVTVITFVTNGATSTFDLTALTGSGTYALTHTGATATLTLNGWDTSNILR